MSQVKSIIQYSVSMRAKLMHSGAVCTLHGCNIYRVPVQDTWTDV